MNPLTSVIFQCLNNMHAASITNPKGYLNRLLLDACPTVCQNGWKPFNSVSRQSSCAQPEANATLQTLSSVQLGVQKSDIVTIFTSSSSSTAAYFDNLRINHRSVPLLKESDTYAFGGGIDALESRSFGRAENKYGYNCKEKQPDLGLEWLDYGARMYDAQVGRMNHMDIMADKYSGITPYNYAANLPTRVTDPDGMDWIFSTYNYKDKNGNDQTGIKLTFSGAILNSSGKVIDIKNYIKEQEKIFKDIFEQGNVTFNLALNEVSSKDEVGEFQHLIEIKPGTMNEDGETHGGSAAYGGKYIELSAAGINSNGTVVDKRALAHEAGHSAGLAHPWDFTKFKNGGVYMMNNRAVNMNMQKFNYSDNLTPTDILTRNFMGYTSRSVQIAQTGGGTTSERVLVQYYNNNVGKATQGQIQTIINNIYSGALNKRNTTGIQGD